MKTKGLGKGLNALFGDTSEEYELAIENGRDGASLELPIDLVFPDENQPRKTFDKTALDELKRSIISHGVINPIVVNKIGEKYQIVAGERRYRASILAGLEKIPAIVMDLNEKKIREIALIENLQREDLNVVEAARGIKELMSKYGLTQETVADRISKPRSAIANLIRILNLPEEVLSLLENNKLSLGHAKVLAGLSKSSDVIRLAESSSDGKMSVRELEKKVQLLSIEPKEKKSIPPLSADLKSFEDKMTKTFATKVSLQGNEIKGKIVIDYFTKDDLERIYELIAKIK